MEVINTTLDKIKSTRVSLKETLPYIGPAFLVSVGYMDPGNWATNIEGGSRFGYQLLAVLFISNLMAILLQTMAARLGIVTGKTLAQNCREQYSRKLNFGLWVLAELAMIATDIAEFIGAAIGFYILFGIPLFSSGLITAVVVFIILGFYKLGYRSVEYIIISLVAVIGFSYLVELILAKPNWTDVAHNVFIPHLDSTNLYVALGMLGATVMPHNLFLHSGLTLSRTIISPDEPKVKRDKKLIRFAIIDSLFALNMSWLVNSAMVVMAGAVFFTNGIEVTSLQEAHKTLEPLLGSLSSFVFAIALLASGLSSSTTSTIAGQMVLEGFLDIKFNIWIRRLITVVPALFIIYLGFNELQILVLSQVVLSLHLPFAIIPLIKFTHDKKLMGENKSPVWVHWLAVITAVTISVLNILLIMKLMGGKF